MKNSIKFLAVIIILVFISKILTAYPQEELEAESVMELEAESVPELKEINFQVVDADRIEFIVEVEGEFDYEIFGLSGPSRIAIDLFPIQKISVGPYVDIGVVGVMRIRVGLFQPEVARVVFDLGERTPNHKVTSIEGGIKVSFWFEELIPKEEKPFEVKEVGIRPERIPKEVPRVVVVEIVPKVPRILDHYYSVQGKMGIGFPINPSFENQSSFSLYGEQASLNESYKLKTNLLFDLNFGRFFWIKDSLFKANLSLSYLSFKNDGSFQMAIPHPVIADSPRDYVFEDNLKGSVFNISLSPLFSIMEKKKFEIWAGPIIGFSFGELSILEDISLEERSPFTSADINVTAKTFLEEKISSLLFGVAGNFEYKIARKFSLLLDTKFFYLSPKSKTLDMRINLSQVQLSLGFLFYF